MDIAFQVTHDGGSAKKPFPIVKLLEHHDLVLPAAYEISHETLSTCVREAMRLKRDYDVRHMAPGDPIIEATAGSVDAGTSSPPPKRGQGKQGARTSIASDAVPALTARGRVLAELLSIMFQMSTNNLRALDLAVLVPLYSARSRVFGFAAQTQGEHQLGGSITIRMRHDDHATLRTAARQVAAALLSQTWAREVITTEEGAFILHGQRLSLIQRRRHRTVDSNVLNVRTQFTKIVLYEPGRGEVSAQDGTVEVIRSLTWRVLRSQPTSTLACLGTIFLAASFFIRPELVHTSMGYALAPDQSLPHWLLSADDPLSKIGPALVGATTVDAARRWAQLRDEIRETGEEAHAGVFIRWQNPDRRPR